MAEYKYNTIEEALESLRQGKIILVTDDEDRENEGDMICAGEFATQANINFMACYAKGLICTPMSGELAAKLGLYPMVTKNTDNHETNNNHFPCRPHPDVGDVSGQHYPSWQEAPKADSPSKQ